MATSHKNLPRFMPDMGSSSTFDLLGLVDVSPANSQFGQYRRIPALSDNIVQEGVDPSVNRLFASRERDVQISLALSETEIWLLVSGEYVKQTLETEDFQTKSFPVEFNNLLYTIQSNGAIYLVNSTGLTKQNANLESELAELNVIQAGIQEVRVWLGRVWLTAGDKGLACDVTNILEWDTTRTVAGRTAATTALSTQLPANRLISLDGLARTLFLFADDTVFDVEVTNIDLGIRVTEFMRNLTFKGGVVNHKDALYFLEEQAVRIITSDRQTAQISLDIDLEYKAFIDSTEIKDISSVVVGDIIYWSNMRSILIYDTKWKKFSSIQSRPGIVFGTYQTPGTTVDQLTGTVDELPGTVDSLSSDALSLPVGLFMGSMYTFQIPDSTKLCFQITRTSNRQKLMIRCLDFPELKDYCVQIRDGGTSEWGPKYYPNRWGDIKIAKRYYSPEVRIETTDKFDQLNVFSIDSTLLNSR